MSNGSNIGGVRQGGTTISPQELAEKIAKDKDNPMALKQDLEVAKAMDPSSKGTIEAYLHKHHHPELAKSLAEATGSVGSGVGAGLD